MTFLALIDRHWDDVMILALATLCLGFVLVAELPWRRLWRRL
jgi:hypothetical protein